MRAMTCTALWVLRFNTMGARRFAVMFQGAPSGMETTISSARSAGFVEPTRVSSSSGMRAL